MKFLPACSFRQELNQSDVYYCRHTKVHTTDNLVTNEICQRCAWHEMHCENPRPADYEMRAEVSPTLVSKVIGARSAAIAFVADGMRLLSDDQTAERLRICASCEDHQGNWCRRCGCNLAVKARGRAFECPAGKWPQPLADKESQIPSVQ